MQDIIATTAHYPWLNQPLLQLQKMFQSRKFPHALLLVGQEGLGKTFLAKTVAQLLLCMTPQGNQSCGHCTACRLYQEQLHPDFRSLGDNQVNINIDEIREITDFLSKAPHQAGNRVIVIAADHLSIACANGLLKILEEPPSNTYFILMARHPAALLPTIRSRCFAMNLPLPTHQVALNWLQQHVHSTLDDLTWCLKIAGGAPLKAQVLAEKTLDKNLAILIKMLHTPNFSFYHRDETQRWLISDISEALYLLYYWLTELTRYIATGTTVFAPSHIENFAPLAHLSGKTLLLFLDKVLDALQAVKVPGVNKQLLLESLIYEWHVVLRSHR